MMSIMIWGEGDHEAGEIGGKNQSVNASEHTKYSDEKEAESYAWGVKGKQKIVIFFLELERAFVQVRSPFKLFSDLTSLGL